MSKQVLVTGGAGYIGCVLVPRLLERGYSVRVFDKLVFGKEGLMPVEDKIELLSGDIRAMDSKILDGVDAVIHLAGISNDPTAEFDPKANESINTHGTISLARECRAAGIRRFLFASSCSVYYTMEPDDGIRDEQYSIDPKAPYSRSKYDAEKALLELAGDRFCPVILRKGTVFGPSPRMRYDLVVNTFVKDAFQSRRLTIHAGGRMWRPLVHIEDVVDAYMVALEAPEERVRSGIFNVLSGNFQVIKVAYEVRRALESQRGIHLNLEVQQVGVVRSYRVSSDKFGETFDIQLGRGITPAGTAIWDDLEEGIDPDAAIYYNIRWLEMLTEMQKRLADMGGSPL